MLLLICFTKLNFLPYLFDLVVSLYSINALDLVMRQKKKCRTGQYMHD